MKKIALSLLIACLVILHANAQPSLFKEYSFVQALTGDNAKTVYETGDENIWVGTYSGLAIYDGSAWIQETSFGGAAATNCYAILEAQNGTIWVGIGGGSLSKYEGDTWTNLDADDGVQGTTIWALAEDSSGNIWAGSSTAGVNVFDGLDWTNYGMNDGLPGNSVSAMECDYLGNVWLATANGLSKYDGSEFQNFTQEDGIPANIVNDLELDRDGNIWIATNNGIGIYNGVEWSSLNTSDGLPTNNILSLEYAHNGDMLAGTTEGVVIYDGSNFDLMDYQNGLPQDIVTEVFQDSHGKIWIVTPYNGVAVADRSEAFLGYRYNEGLVDDNVNEIMADGDTIFVATDQGGNSFNGHLWRSFKTMTGNAMVGDSVMDVDSKDGNTWFATKSGVTHYFNQEYVSYTSEDGLLSDTTLAIVIDASGEAWVGTNYGVNIIHSDGQIDAIQTDDGLVNDTVRAILIDDNGDFWFGTMQGISVYDGSVFTNYTSTDIGGDEVFSLDMDQNGDIWAGTEYTLAKYDMAGDTWDHWAHSYPDDHIISIEERDTYMYHAYDAAGTTSVFYFDIASESFGSMEVGMTVNTICNLNDQYFFMGGDAGIKSYLYYAGTQSPADITHPTCNNTSDGSITTSGTPFPPSHMHSIDNGLNWQSSNVFNGLSAGFYHVKIKDASDYIVKDELVYLEPQISFTPVIGIEQIDCAGNANGYIELFPDAPSASYTWLDSGTGLVRDNLVPGNYGVNLSYSGCSVSLGNEIIEPESLESIVTKTDILCYADNTGAIDMEISGGTPVYDYSWDSGQETEDLTDLYAGEYAVTVTDAHGCQVFETVNITQPAAALEVSGEVTNVTCFGLENGVIDLDIIGGTADYDISWDSGDETEDLSDLPAGDYAVTVTDANLCTASAAFTVDQPEELEFSDVEYENILCNGDSTGLVEVVIGGGTPDYSFEWTYSENPEWTSSNQNIEDLPPGAYTLVVDDQNGCQIDSTLTLTQPPALELELESTDITCSGYDNGTVAAVPSGGTEIYISYLWYYNNGETPMAVDSLVEDCAPGKYKVVVTDSYYCTISDSVVLTEPEPMEVEVNVTEISCHGVEDGSIEVIVNGGDDEGMTYTWSNGAGDMNSISGLGEDTYTVTITDELGCEETAEASLTEPPMEDLGAFPESQEMGLCEDGSITLDAGSGYEVYEWSTGETGLSSIEVDTEDTYIVFVQDAYGCQYEDTVDVFMVSPYEGQEICLVSVNEDNQNTVIWNPASDAGIDSYNIYRKNEFSGSWDITGTVDNGIGLYNDADVNPSENDYAYKISITDTCGNESQLSNAHSTIHLNVTDDGFGHCELSWTEYEGYFVVMYYIMRGQEEDNMESIDSVLFNDFDYVDTTTLDYLDPGYYYKIRVRKTDPCTPGGAETYSEAFSNTVFCDPYVGKVGETVQDIGVFPNPFQERIMLRFNLATSSHVRVELYNSLGQKTHILADRYQSPGLFRKEFMVDLEPGVYVLKIEANGKMYRKKLIRR